MHDLMCTTAFLGRSELLLVKASYTPSRTTALVLCLKYRIQSVNTSKRCLDHPGRQAVHAYPHESTTVLCCC